MGDGSTLGEGCMNNFLDMPALDTVQPCIADPTRIRFISLLDMDISPVLPYLNAVVKGAIYNRHGHTLTVRREGRIVTLHPNKIAGAKIRDRDDAMSILSEMVDLINDCHERMDEIEPDYERRASLGVLDIYKLLPGTNCRRCGEATCLAFAAKLAKEAAGIAQCPVIYTADFQEKRKLLSLMLTDAGYSVPEFT